MVMLMVPWTNKPPLFNLGCPLLVAIHYFPWVLGLGFWPTKESTPLQQPTTILKKIHTFLFSIDVSAFAMNVPSFSNDTSIDPKQCK